MIETETVVVKETLAVLLKLNDVVPTQTAGKEVIDALIDELRAAFHKGLKVKLNRFGVFTVKETAARTGRNPKTGEEFVIPAARTVRFKPSKKLLEGLK
ncbi:MAG: HU family DNA-binding protein [Candidatus Competibacteraceae bacterium]